MVWLSFYHDSQPFMAESASKPMIEWAKEIAFQQRFLENKEVYM